jgi:diketogulonate reductase-like aldo/keto reductase
VTGAGGPSGSPGRRAGLAGIVRAMSERRFALMYGTAWKELETERLTAQALAAGFRAIDTANQRKHYHEAGVGAAVVASGLPRAALFLQTKFTYVRGQDQRLPYDPKAAIADQVAQSFARSLEHLSTDHIDSYVLHGPWASGFCAQDREAWHAMEALHASGQARALGVSNVSVDQLERLCAEAKRPPTFVQNRCYARHGWDREVRSFATRHGIVYQGFSLLTANRAELATRTVSDVARRLGATVPQLVFRFALALGILPLTGTRDATHMQEDLACTSFVLEAEDVERIERVSGA